MALKGKGFKIVDLRKAPKDIVNSFKAGKVLGNKIEKLSQTRKKLTELLRSKIPL